MSIAAARRGRYSVPSVRASLGTGGSGGRRSGWSLFGSSSDKAPDKSSGKSAASRIADYRPAPARDISSRVQQNGKAGNKYREKRASFSFSLGGLGQGVAGVLAFFGRLFLFASALLFLAAISVGLLMSYRWMTTLPYFALQEIAVQGNARMTAAEVVAACGVEMGQNALALNIREVENGLVQSPWIETASVKRVLPGKLEILVAERTPRFWVHKDDRLYYADEAGQLIAPVDTDRFVSLPILEIEGEEIGRRLDMLPELAAMVNGKGLPFGGKGISWLRISARDGIEIYLDDYDVVLSTPLDDWKEGLARIGKVWQDLQRRKEVAQIKSVRAAGSKVLVYKKA